MSDNWSEDELNQKLRDDPELAALNPQLIKNGLRIINETPARQSVVNVQPNERQNKYHVSAKEDRTYNGIVYASKKEAEYAQELGLRVKAGEIDFYLRQVPFPLPGNITYRADFVTFKYYPTAQIKLHFLARNADKSDSHAFVAYPLWSVTVIEVKGMETPAWKLKHKLFKATYPNLRIEVVR